jgi:hypothetical protein
MGLGDLVPISEPERLLGSLVLLFGVIMMSYNLG